jgi:hypothetical protein
MEHDKKRKQYIMALVHLPIEITPNGSCEPMSNHIHISFEPCEVLPKPTNPSETAAFAAHFRGILSSFTNPMGEDQEPVFQKIRLEEDNDESEEEVELDDEEELEDDEDEDEDKSNDHQENHQEPNLSVLHVLQSEIQHHNRKIKQQFDITFKKRDKQNNRHTAKLR